MGVQVVSRIYERFIPLFRPNPSSNHNHNHTTATTCATTTTTTEALPSVAPMVKCPPMSEHDRHKDACTLLGLLRRDEDSLNDVAKQLVKHDREYARAVFMHEVDGWTPFHAFVLKGARKMLKLALKAGVDVNMTMGAPDGLPRGCTALHLAAHRGDVAVINILVSHGAVINQKDDSDRSPVVYASQTGNTLAVKTLQRAGADMRGCDDHKQSAEDKEKSTSPMVCFLPFVCAGIRR